MEILFHPEDYSLGKNSTFSGMLCVLTAAMLWGTTGTLQGLLPPAREPVVVGALRVLLASVGLWAAFLISAPSTKSMPELPKRRIFAAGLAIAGYNLFFFAGVSLAGVGVGTAIALGSGPLWVSLFELVFSGFRPSPRSLAGQAAAITGLTVLVAGDIGQGGAFSGYVLSALAGLSYGSYVYITGGVNQKIPSTLLAAATFSVSSLVLAPSFLLLSTAWIDLRSIFLLLFLGLVAASIPFFLFTFGVRQMHASTAVTLSLAEPFTAWVLATVVLGEPVTQSKVVGALILVVGIRIVAGATRSSD